MCVAVRADYGAGMGREMLVVGGGEVATALETYAATLDWECCTTESLDEVRHRLGAAEPPQAVVVLSHHDGLDAPALAAALASGTPYVGAMGSRRTQERRRAQLVRDGVGEPALARVHGPAGLDLGADGPAEIALSVVAEALAVLSGRVSDRSGAGSLRDRAGPIHPELAPGEAHCPG